MVVRLVEVVCLSVLPGLMAAAAWTDVRSFRIPNWISGAIALVFIVWAAAHPVERLLPGLLVGFGVLLVGAGLYAVKVWGAGDAKLLAALAAWTGLSQFPRLAIVVALAGGAMAIGTLMLRRFMVGFGWLSAPAAELPYGLAIVAGGFDWWVREMIARGTF